MMPSDRQPEQPDYPFLADPRVSPSMKKHYIGLRSFDKGDGAFMAVETLAEKLGVDRRTVMRNRRKLQAVGLIKVKKQFRDGRQRTNFYTFPIPDWWVSAEPGSVKSDPVEGGQEGVSRGGANAPLSTCTTGVDGDGEELEIVSTGSSDISIEIEYQGEGLRPSRVDAASQGNGEGSRERGERVGPPLPDRGSPMPMGNFRSRFFDRESQVAWLTSYFEGLVIDRDNRLREAKGQKPKTTVGPVRQSKFLNAARCLLSGRDAPGLAEVVAVLDWLFGTWMGYLPFVENTDWPTTDGKITRLWTIRNHYAELVAAMSQGATPDPVEEIPTAMSSQRAKLEPVKEIPISTEIAISRPKAYYDHGADFPMEDQVAELVEKFAKFKNRRLPGYKISDYDLFGWRKTFRIMLGHHKIPFDEARLVVDALAEGRLALDYGRYSSPYDLVRRRREVVGIPGEWKNILGWVKIALEREHMRPSPAPSRQLPFDGDGVVHYCDDDDDDGRSVDMATNAEERHRRYLARAARRRSA